MVALFRHKTEQRAPTPIPPLEDRLAVWQAEDERLSHLLETARQFRGFSADEIERLLRRHHYTAIQHFGPAEALAMYFPGRSGVDLGGAQRLITATVDRNG